MDRVHYAGDSVLTGTAIAHALLAYAEALAQVGAARTVTIPTINADGSRGHSAILVGPASQIISDEEESAYEEVVDDGLVDDLTRETARLRQRGLAAPAFPFDEPPEDWPDHLG